MDDARIGTLIRALRLRKGWTQEELAGRAGTSRWTILRVERGQIGSVRLDRLRLIARALGARLDAIVRWDGGELDRLVNGRHSAMHELIARKFIALPGWIAVPEVTFGIYGERGTVDVLAWHAATGTVLVVELKTEIVDVQELIGTLDRKRRLARTIARERGWDARHVAAWLVVAESRTNRRRVAAHGSVLRSALPGSARGLADWLRAPTEPPLAALTFVSDVHGSRARSGLATPKRVGRRGRRCATTTDLAS
jgi:transcriptional regulator with XRE-family HTH domain